jgi:hypothetical protein
MTRVTLHYRLARKLTDDDCAAVSALHGVYGIVRVELAPSLDRIAVDYDASRLTRTEVEAQLARHGLPIHA